MHDSVVPLVLLLLYELPETVPHLCNAKSGFLQEDVVSLSIVNNNGKIIVEFSVTFSVAVV